MKPVQILLLIIVLFYVTPSVLADPIIIYDNITTTQYKTLKVTSDLCVYGMTCNNLLYINGLLVGTYKNGDSIEVPDDSDVRIVLDDPINTNLQDTYDTNKNSLLIAIMYFIQPIAVIAFIVLLLFLIFRKRKERY